MAGLMLGFGPTASAHAAASSDGGYPLNSATAIYEAAPGTALDLTDEVTLEAWVKADPMDEAGGRILDKSAPGTQVGYYSTSNGQPHDLMLAARSRVPGMSMRGPGGGGRGRGPGGRGGPDTQPGRQQ